MKSESYVQLLIGEYVERKSTDKAYSERAFARSLGLSAGFLKLLFQGKKNLSLERAKAVSDLLEWNGSKKNTFLKRVKYSSTRTSAKAKGKILLHRDDFFEVSDWYHFAIIEFIKTKKHKVTAPELVSAFKVSLTEINYAIKNLIKIGLIENDGENQFKVPSRYEIPSTSSTGIRKYHKQLLQKAKEAVEEQKFNQRDFRGLTLAFNIEKIEEAKCCLEKFVADFDKKFGSGTADTVYQLNTSFFRLDKETT